MFILRQGGFYEIFITYYVKSTLVSRYRILVSLEILHLLISFMIYHKPTLEFIFLDLGQRYFIPKIVHFIQGYNKIVHFGYPKLLYCGNKRGFDLPVSVVRIFGLVLIFSLKDICPLRHRTFEMKT